MGPKINCTHTQRVLKQTTLGTESKGTMYKNSIASNFRQSEEHSGYNELHDTGPISPHVIYLGLLPNSPDGHPLVSAYLGTYIKTYSSTGMQVDQERQ